MAKSNAGRKPDPNKKLRIVLFVKKSDIVGEDNMHLHVDSEEFAEKKQKLMQDLYETIEFIK